MSPKNKDHYQSEKKAIHLLLTGIRDEIYSTVDACKTAHDMWLTIERLLHDESLNIQDVKTNLFWEFLMMESQWISYHKLFDVLKQYQKEVNEIHAKRIAKNAISLALVAAAQQYLDPYYQAPKSHKSYAPPSKQSYSTRSNASTKYKGKEIAKPITPLSESAFEEDNDPEQAQRDGDMQKNLALIRKDRSTRSGSTLQLYKQDDKGVPLQAKIQEVPTADSGTDIEPLEKTDQNAEECDDEHIALATLIANLKLNIDENKKIQKQLKKSNASFTQELKECKSNLEESNTTRDSCLIALQSKQTELDTYKTLNDRTVDYEKLERK
ncbi:hypothetical protein Tco_0678759 [Tanacetum coccineum]|uniref:No apical meristem-associated C-terminal domain-containing protein n=1 Tax=Tanacetum coccineum TaxID=301880 RepID=A0ABQ4XH73_9ASTR